jgi:hypothetical protein
MSGAMSGATPVANTSAREDDSEHITKPSDRDHAGTPFSRVFLYRRAVATNADSTSNSPACAEPTVPRGEAMNAPQPSPSLTLTIGQPSPNQVIVPGAGFTVSGLAIGTGGSEPRPIESVTVQIGSAAPAAANLKPPPHPSPLTMAYTFPVPGPPVLNAGGVTFTITVIATDVLGERRLRQSQSELSQSVRWTPRHVPVVSPGTTIL